MDCTSFYKIGTYAMGDNRVPQLFAGAPIKLINNFNDRQGVCIAPRYLLDCFQCSIIKVRSDLNNCNSGYCSVCCLCHWCLSYRMTSDSIRRLQLVNRPVTQKNTQDNSQPEIKLIIHSQLGKLDRICLRLVNWKRGDLLLCPPPFCK